MGLVEGLGEDTRTRSVGHLDSMGVGLVIIHSFPHSFPNRVQHLFAKPCSPCRCYAAVGLLVTGKGEVGRWTEGWTARRGSLEQLHPVVSRPRSLKWWGDPNLSWQPDVGARGEPHNLTPINMILMQAGPPCSPAFC